MSASDWLTVLPGVLRDEPLSRHSQFGVGGPADWFLKVRDTEAMQVVRRGCAERSISLTTIGAGSNALILDAGIRGLVVRFDDSRVRARSDDAVELGAGAMMPRAALDCARQGFAGLEFGIGVPGTCGASIYGNAGAFGTEIADVLVDCTVLSPAGEAQVLTAAECGFRYRHSRLQDELRGHVVASARLRVHTADPNEVRRRTDEIQAQRKASQPYGVRSLGSVFKNPPGDSAGRLVEACGLKGRRYGGAQFSEKHCNFLINAGGATAADVAALKNEAQRRIREQFGIEMENEVALVGEGFGDE